MRKLTGKGKKAKAEANKNDAPHEVNTEDNGEPVDDKSGKEDESEIVENVKSAAKSKKGKRGRKDDEPEKEDENGDSEESNEKRKKKSTDPEPDEENEVESILDMRVVRGQKEFLIHWKGYPDGDTWEPVSNLNCDELIKEYLEKHPEDSKNTGSKKRGAKADDLAESKNKKKKVSAKAEDKGEEEDDEDKSYEVESIREVHFKKNGKKEFLIHWKGYSHTEDTWEPEENLDCAELIEKFLAKVDKAKSNNRRELRENPQHTKRFAGGKSPGTRQSRRNKNKERTTYHNAE